VATLVQLTAWKSALEAARFSGAKEVYYDNQRIVYRSDDEMLAALSDLNAQIHAASSAQPPPINRIVVTMTKGTW